jgi:hypothetical protein
MLSLKSFNIIAMILSLEIATFHTLFSSCLLELLTGDTYDKIDNRPLSIVINNVTYF